MSISFTLNRNLTSTKQIRHQVAKQEIETFPNSYIEARFIFEIKTSFDLNVFLKCLVVLQSSNGPVLNDFC